MTAEFLTALAIDDDSVDADLLRRQLERTNGCDVRMIHSPNLSDARRVLASEPVDVIFVDYYLGSEDGIKAIQSLRSTKEHRPIIGLTGHGNESTVRDFLQNGADEYLSKNDMDGEKLQRVLQSAMGIAQRRRLESVNQELLAELQQKSEALEGKNRRLSEMYDTAHEFVDNVSHEFRTPLTVIKEFTSIIYDGLAGETTVQQKEYLLTVLDRVDDLATLIDDMLDVSKLEAGVLGIARKTCRIEDIVERVHKTLERKAAANRVSLSVALPEALPSVLCDPEKIGRVLINLTINAVKFSKEQGSVVIRVSVQESPGQVRLEVNDAGPGIAADKIAAIFERFCQLEDKGGACAKGFGLGLNIARELVRLNFGDIGVESTPGKGSTFWFSVPTADPEKFIHRYLDRIDTIRSGSSVASLVALRAPDLSDVGLLDETETFLQHQLRRSDVLFRTRPGDWLLVAGGEHQDCSKLRERIETSRNEVNRNRPRAPLPAVSWNVIGTWPLDTGRQSLVEAFQKRFAEEKATCG